MADHQDPDEVWDEYDWERFLQQQDRKTERYMELLERYSDDPQRDQIIAREMGWFHLMNKEGEAWAEHVDSLFDPEDGVEGALGDEGDEGDAGDGEGEDEDFEVHPLYKMAFTVGARVERWVEDAGEAGTLPDAAQLSTQMAVAGAKLAAGLGCDDLDELGMTIAYLKRALRALTVALEAAGRLHEDGRMLNHDHDEIRAGIFQVRDGVVELMGRHRAEWMRRFGRR